MARLDEKEQSGQRSPQVRAMGSQTLSPGALGMKLFLGDPPRTFLPDKS